MAARAWLSKRTSLDTDARFCEREWPCGTKALARAERSTQIDGVTPLDWDNFRGTISAERCTGRGPLSRTAQHSTAAPAPARELHGAQVLASADAPTCPPGSGSNAPSLFTGRHARVVAMPPASGQAPAPVASFASGWSAVPLDAEASRRLAQRRIGFFAGVFLALSVAFFLRNSIAIAVLSGTWPPFTHPAFLLHGAALALHTGQWSLCRVGQLSRRQLAVLDAIGLVGAMALYGALTVAEVMTLEHAVAVQSAGAEVLLVAIIQLALVLIHA